MKFKFYIFVLSVISVFGYSQKISLTWDGYKQMDYGSEVVTYPFFSNYNYQVEPNSIFVNLNIKTTNQVSLDQFVWEALPAKDIQDLKINSISAKPKSSVHYFYNETEKAESAGISVEALKVENNKIYKLISFNITETSKKTTELYKGANKSGTTENPLKSGTFYKIKVDKSGIFKITKQFLDDPERMLRYLFRD